VLTPSRSWFRTWHLDLTAYVCGSAVVFVWFLANIPWDVVPFAEFPFVCDRVRVELEYLQL